MKSFILLASFLATSIAMACPSDKLCNGDRIIDSSNNIGEVIEVFSNGKAKVLFDGSFSYSFRLFSSLGIELNCRLRENCSCRN